MQESGEFVDFGQRAVNPDIYFDRTLFDAEQEKVFGRCWLFLAHESQIPNPFDFMTTRMGLEPIIVWRGRDGNVRAFINSCRHRGMQICRVDRGNARAFSCPYHAWRYDAGGRLIGVPNRERYGESFDPAEWGLVEVPRLQSYAGFIFGNLDENAETFEEYLGDFRYYVDVMMKRTPEGMIFLPGRQTWTVDANWKLAAEQTAGDQSHAATTHRSIGMLGYLGDLSEFAKRQEDFQVTERGHGLIVLGHPIPPNAPDGFKAYEAGVREAAASRMPPEQAALIDAGLVLQIFPNLCFIYFGGAMSLRQYHPTGIGSMEVFYWALADREAPEWRKKLSHREVMLNYHGGGMIDSDDAEMWMGSRSGLMGAYRRKFPSNFDIGCETARRGNIRPGLIDKVPTETGCLGFYEKWAELMELDHGNL
jgi:3-phenylpropionate/trans-cinnamate dioxygenase alpha subunit